MEWYYPYNLSEFGSLISKEGFYIHGGGTALLRRGFHGINALISLDKLELNKCEQNATAVKLGAACTLSSAAEFVEKINPESILAKAFHGALPQALRNRITLGGSIVSFPGWSDVIGPLLALNASLEIYFENKNSVISLEEYLNNKNSYKKALITSVSFEEKNWVSHYFRATRTEFDYSFFNISILVDNIKKPNEARIFLVGSKKKWERLDQVEKELVGKKPSELDVNSIVKFFDCEFSDKKLGSSAYLKELAQVELGRAIENVFKLN